VSTSNPLAPGQIEPAQPGSKRFTAWHAGTALLLALGYSGYYFCRSDLSVVLPVLIRDLAQHGITPNEAQIKLGFMASVGTVAYALGKFFSGALADLDLYHLPDSYIDDFGPQLLRVDAPASRQVVATAYPRAEDVDIVLIGDAARIRAEVSKFGAVLEKPLEAADFKPPAQ